MKRLSNVDSASRSMSSPKFLAELDFPRCRDIVEFIGDHALLNSMDLHYGDHALPVCHNVSPSNLKPLCTHQIIYHRRVVYSKCYYITLHHYQISSLKIIFKKS